MQQYRVFSWGQESTLSHVGRRVSSKTAWVGEIRPMTFTEGQVILNGSG